MPSPDNNPGLHGNVPDQCAVALLLLDVLNPLGFEGGQAFAPRALATAQRVRRLTTNARRAGVPVIYVNDNTFGRWRSDLPPTLAHWSQADAPGSPIVRVLAPEAEDYVVLKPKHSGFYATPLEVVLLYMRARRLVIAGFTTDQCVLLSVHMRGAKPETVRVERAVIDQRQRDLTHVQMNTLEELADAAGMTTEMVKSMLDGSESYAADQPSLYVGALTAKRGGKQESIMERFRKTRDGAWIRTQADRVDSGSKVATITSLDMRVTPRRGRATVTIQLAGAKFKLELNGDRLDTRSPEVNLRIK